MGETIWHKSACNLCYVNCGIEVAVEGEGEAARIKRVRGDEANPKSRGYLCNKAQGIVSYVHHKDRLTSPLRRRADGSHEAISWHTAVTEIAARLRGVIDQHGAQSLALYGGGGQGNHAGGAFVTAFMRGLGSRHVFNALAQEKTGDFWVNGHLFGAQNCHSAEDIEHCDLLLVLGANPWLAHGFANARQQLNEIAKDPARKLIVIDPRRSETAAQADVHIAVRPGADAYLLTALLAMLIRQGVVDEKFLLAHVTGFDEVKACLLEVPINEFAAAADVSLATLEQVVAMIAASKAMVVRAELGIQQGRYSTLNSYLEKLLFLLAGNFGKRGTNVLHSWLQPLWGNGRGQRYAPLGIEVIAGLLPPNVLADAIESPHPEHLRALWVDSSNPVNTAADTQRVLAAFGQLDLLVVVDVAMTETAALADYVLPASSQYEKCEYTLFSFEYPTNYFHVRRPILPPLPGTLSEPEIYTRLAQAMNLLPPQATMDELVDRAALGHSAFGAGFEAMLRKHPESMAVAPLVLFNTLGRVLPHGTAAAAPLWAAAQRLARTRAASVSAALGITQTLAPQELGARLFDRIIASPSGTAFSIDDNVWDLIETSDRKIRLAIPVLLAEIAVLQPSQAAPRADYPYVLSAGQRRAQNANQNFRAPDFRKRDPDGALFIHPDDLVALSAKEGDWLVVESQRGELVVRSRLDAGLRPGYVVLPHGYGQAYPAADGKRRVCGPAINWLTDSAWRDPIAGTPYHKHVPVRLRVADEVQSMVAETNSRAVLARAEA